MSDNYLQTNLEIRLKSYFYGILILVLLLSASVLCFYLLDKTLPTLFHWKILATKWMTLAGVVLIVLLGGVISYLIYTSTSIASPKALFNRQFGYIRTVLILTSVVLFVLVCFSVFIPVFTYNIAAAGAKNIPDYIRLFVSIKYQLLTVFVIAILFIPVSVRLLFNRRIVGHIPPPVEKFNTIVTLFLLIVSMLVLNIFAPVFWDALKSATQVIFELKEDQKQRINITAMIVIVVLSLSLIFSVQSLKGQYSYIASVWVSPLYRLSGVALLLVSVAIVYCLLLAIELREYTDVAIKPVLKIGKIEISNIDYYQKYLVYVISLCLAMSIFAIPLFISRLRILYLKWSNISRIYNVHGGQQD